MNSAASQYVGTQRLHRFVAIDDEHVFRAHLKGNRRLLGTEHLQVFWKRAFRKALPLRSGRDQRDLNLDSSCLFRKGAGIGRPRTNAKACLLASGCYENCGLLQSRVGNLKVSDLWSAADHFRQDLQHFWIAASEIGVRVLIFCPKD